MPQNGEPELITDLCRLLAGKTESSRDAEWTEQKWEALVTRAERENLAPALSYRLSMTERPELPDQLHRKLRRSYAVALASNALRYRELSILLPVLHQILPADRPPIVLKGAALALSLYPRVGARPMSDLDLLVPSSSLDETMESIRALGYREVIPAMGPGLHRSLGHAIPLAGGPHETVLVDVHWALIAGENDWRSPPMDWFWKEVVEWERPEDASGLGDEGPASELPTRFFHFTPTAHLLHLAAHLGLQHPLEEKRLQKLPPDHGGRDERLLRPLLSERCHAEVGRFGPNGLRS